MSNLIGNSDDWIFSDVDHFSALLLLMHTVQYNSFFHFIKNSNFLKKKKEVERQVPHKEI